MQRAAIERRESLNFVHNAGNLEAKAVSDRCEIEKDYEFMRLRDIIEDYLEVQDSIMNKASVNKYLAVNTLAKYFRIVQVEMGDLVYDVNEDADAVTFHTIEFKKITSVSRYIF